MNAPTCSPFGITRDGQEVSLYTLRSASGVEVRILNRGCTIQSILVPDRRGNPVDVVLGYDDLSGYELGSCHHGAFIGRYANRIRNAAFTLNGKTYSLEKNDGENHLHGIYERICFDAAQDGNSLVFRRLSPAGEEGFPGTLSLEIRYTLREDNALVLDYLAHTDADTVLNLTNHTYFNLNGGGDILAHTLTLNADRFTEVDNQILPTGRILPVENTPLDFRRGRCVGAAIRTGAPELASFGGYDHNLILRPSTDSLPLAARLLGDQTGIAMEVYTTQPGIQLYTGNFLPADTAPCAKGGIRYPRWGGLCLETQHFPCSPNFLSFPSTVLQPGAEYRHTTIYRFPAPQSKSVSSEQA